MKINATIWGENIHDKKNKDVKKIYPDGMHSCIEAALKNEPNINTKTATLDQDNHGLSDDILRNTYVFVMSFLGLGGRSKYWGWESVSFHHPWGNSLSCHHPC